MLVLLSFVMVLVATVLLVLGLLVSGDGLAFIYVSIGMSAVAAVLLIIAVRMSKPAVATAGGPAPLAPEPERELAGVGAGSSASATSTTTLPAVTPAAEAVPMAPPPVEGEGESGTEWLASDSEWGAGDGWGSTDELDFPIADYDDLTVDEVLPLLPQLYSDELDVVEARERQGLNRREVLARLAELRITGTDADREAAGEEEAAEADVQRWEDELAAGGEPIPGYDGLAVSEIVAAVASLDDASLDAVRAHEAATKNRRTVLTAIDKRLGVTAAAPAPARKKAAPARKKAAPAKKAPAPARKKAAPARKAAAPAKKAAAPARKQAAPAKKAATPAKKAAPARKKAAPAKKAPAAKKAAKKR